MHGRWVYFIQAEKGPIKIGSAADPEIRLAQLQVSNHETLTLLGACAGGFDREWELHDELQADRIRGEWYRPSEAVLAAVARCTSADDAWDSWEQQRRRAGMMSMTEMEPDTVSTGEPDGDATVDWPEDLV